MLFLQIFGGVFVYNSRITYIRIQEIADSQGTSITEINKQCGISKNTISQSANTGEGMKAKKIFDIATVLGCSADYLLGLTDEPNRYNNINNVATTVSGTQISGNHTTINNRTTSSEDAELLNLIKNLSLVERSKVVLFIDEMKNKET